MRRSAGLSTTSPTSSASGMHRHGAGRGVDAALRFGGRHALHAVAAGLELELRIGALADDARDDFLVAAHLARAFRHDLDLPALALGVARVHAEQVAGEQRRFVAAGAGADFEEDVALVVGVFRQQQLLQVGFELRQSLPCAVLDFRLGEFLHLRVGQHFLRGRRCPPRPAGRRGTARPPASSSACSRVSLR